MNRRGPGKAHRSGITLMQLIQKFPDDATAESWFVDARWPEGIICPHCGSSNVNPNAKHPSMPYRCRERNCRKRFSIKTGTVMECSNLGYQVWAIAIFLIATNLKGISSMKLHRDLGVTQKTAWFLAHRIRETWKINDSSCLNWLPGFPGPIEVDETYIGGKRKNMSHEKRKELTGRGPVGKVAVAGVKDRTTGQVSARVVQGTDSVTLQGFVRHHAVPGTTVYTDEARAYQGMTDLDHHTVNHSVGEYVNDMAHTNGIESFWSMLKRGYQGIFHKISPKHLDRYVSEFAGRHNARLRDTIDIMVSMVARMVGKRVKYHELVA